MDNMGGPQGKVILHPFATVTDNETGDGRYISADALWSFTDVKRDPGDLASVLATLRGKIERSVNIEFDSDSPDED